MILLVIFLGAIFDVVVLPAIIYLGHSNRRAVWSMIQHHAYASIYHTPHLWHYWLQAQPKFLLFLAGFVAIGLIQKARTSRKYKNQSDDYGIRGSARWATKKEIRKWWAS